MYNVTDGPSSLSVFLRYDCHILDQSVISLTPDPQTARPPVLGHILLVIHSGGIEVYLYLVATSALVKGD